MNLKQRISLMIARSYCRFELPGWGRLLRILNYLQGTSDSSRKVPSFRTIRGKNHHFLMNLNINDRDERLTYILGRFIELETAQTMRALLRSGDTVIDVGANRGFFLLSCLPHIGSSGLIYAFEPNPQEADRIDELVQMNSIKNVILHRCALANTESTMELHLLDDLSGLSTLADISSQSRQRITGTVSVAVHRGDAILADVETSNDILMKVDVEGFELEVMKGASRFISDRKPALFVEVEPEWLKRAGTSSAELFSWILERGYKAYKPVSCRGALRYKLALIPMGQVQDDTSLRKEYGEHFRNILWIHPESSYSLRYRAMAQRSEY